MPALSRYRFPWLFVTSNHEQDRGERRCHRSSSLKSRHPDSIAQQIVIQQRVNAPKRTLTLLAVFGIVGPSHFRPAGFRAADFR